jgi:thiol-disulfide isomerase/thioredoxin
MASRLLVLAMLVLALASCKRSAREWPPSMRTASADEVPAEVRAAKGDVALFVLYASWCSSCREELPGLDSLGKQRGVRFLAYSLDEEPQDFAEMLGERRYAFAFARIVPVDNAALRARVRELGGAYRDSIPYVAVLDRKGRLVREWSSNAPARDVERTIELLLE